MDMFVLFLFIIEKNYFIEFVLLFREDLFNWIEVELNEIKFNLFFLCFEYGVVD